MAIAEVERGCTPELVEKVVLVADYDDPVTPDEKILDHGVSRVSIGTFLGLVVNRNERDSLRGAVVVFEHETMRDAHMMGAGQNYFPVEDRVTSSKLAGLVRHLVPRVLVVVCDNEHPVDEVIAHYPRVAPIADLAQLGLAPRA